MTTTAAGHNSVLSHWHQPLTRFGTPVQDFYARVTERVRACAIPDASFSRVEYAEAGVVSARREYLRVERRGFRFDVCAAPFGSGFFVSYWLTKIPIPLWLVAIWIGVVVVSWSTLFTVCAKLLSPGASTIGMGFNPTVAVLQVVAGIVAYLASVVLFFVGLHVVARCNLVDEEVVMAIPLIGWVYRRVFSPTTFYRLDTAQAFRDMVHTCVTDTLKEVTEWSGVRPPTDPEPKPILPGILVA